MAFGEHGQGVASMGPVAGDVNRDGLLDLFIPDLNYNSLLVQGPRGFRDMADVSGLAVVMGQYAGWGAVLFDYDHDGWLDIFTVHGNAHHEYVQEDTLVRNRGDGTFEDVSDHVRSVLPAEILRPRRHLGRLSTTTATSTLWS